MSKHKRNFRVGEGDWLCEDPQCGNINFARRTECNKCGKEKGECSKKRKLGTEIGKNAADKSGGLFSAEDWQCPKCGNINWARRNQCNICNAPKFAETEERTGYGGGYNEREEIEYINRDESDDEYDEFGRIKKEFRIKGNDKDKNQTKEYEIGEEEEEDEDADLSKYDLSEWDNESKSSFEKTSNNSRHLIAESGYIHRNERSRSSEGNSSE